MNKAQFKVVAAEAKTRFLEALTKKMAETQLLCKHTEVKVDKFKERDRTQQFMDCIPLAERVGVRSALDMIAGNTTWKIIFDSCRWHRRSGLSLRRDKVCDVDIAVDTIPDRKIRDKAVKLCDDLDAELKKMLEHEVEFGRLEQMAKNIDKHFLALRNKVEFEMYAAENADVKDMMAAFEKAITASIKG